jgi:hypothetical protein
MADTPNVPQVSKSTPPAKRPQFNWEAKNKKSFANAENIKKALDYLDTKKPEDMALVRQEKKKTEAREDMLVSLHLANEALGKGTKTKDRALSIMQKKLGVDPFKEAKFLEKSTRIFDRKWEDVRADRETTPPAITKAAETAAKEIEKPKEEPRAEEKPKATPQEKVEKGAEKLAAEIKEPLKAKPEAPTQGTETGTTATTARPTATTTPEPEAPKEAPTQEPPKETPTPEAPKETPAPEAPTQEPPKDNGPIPYPSQNLNLRAPEDTKQIPGMIAQLRADASLEIEKIVEKLKASDDVTAKMALSKVLSTKTAFERRSAKYEKEAGAGPMSARKAWVNAQSDAYQAKNTAFKHTLHGTVRRGAERASEAIKGTIDAAKRGTQKIKNKVETSETLAKVRQGVKQAQEKATSGMAQAEEKAGQMLKTGQEKAEQKFQGDKEIVTQFLGQEAAAEFEKASNMKKRVMLNQAYSKRNAAMKQPQPIVTPPPAPVQPKGLLPATLPPAKNEDYNLARKTLKKFMKN